MKKITKFICAMLTSCFALLPFSSCKKDDGIKTVKVNEVTHSVFYAPLYLAESLGYFKEENIQIELTNGGGADNVMASVLSGDSDIGFCGPETALYVLIGGSSDVPTVIGQLTKRDGSFLVSRTPEPDFKWENLKGKEIQKTADTCMRTAASLCYTTETNTTLRSNHTLIKINIKKLVKRIAKKIVTDKIGHYLYT